ncbi:hypothetical protein BC827DRAFT_1218280, partial [Russula dissimulans]
KWSRVLVVLQILTAHGHSIELQVGIFLSAHLRRSHTLCEPRYRHSGPNISLLLIDELSLPAASAGYALALVVAQDHAQAAHPDSGTHSCAPHHS